MKLILFGGAEIDKNQFIPQLKLIEKVIKKYKPKQVLHIPFARPKATEIEWEEGWFQRHMNIGKIQYLNAKNAKDIAQAKKPLIFMSGGGGNVKLLQGIKKNPKLLKLVMSADVIIGESAGCKVLGAYFRTKGSDQNSKMMKGLGLVKDTAIQPHYIERKREKLLLKDLKDTNVKYGLGIDCVTALEIDTKTYPKKYKLIGKGVVELVVKNS